MLYYYITLELSIIIKKKEFLNFDCNIKKNYSLIVIKYITAKQNNQS